jgi:hypothetical protein
MSQSVIGYDKEIKPLFTQVDRDHMKSMFDLWSYEDVKTNANAILDSVSNQRMPPGRPWSADQVERFRQWIQGGYLA